MKMLISLRRALLGVAVAALFVGLSPSASAQLEPNLVRKIVPPIWQATNFTWIGDREPRNKVDDSIDRGTNSTYDIIANFDRCPTENDRAVIERLSQTAKVQRISPYISSILASGLTKQDVYTLSSNLQGVVFIQKQSIYVPSLTVALPAMCVTPGPGGSGCSPNTVAEAFPAINGGGINIAIIDSGVDNSGSPAHGTFAATPFVGGYDAAAAVPFETDPDDQLGHGTHVASIALGQGVGTVGRGVAPAAGLIDVKVFSTTGTTTDAIIFDALEHVYDRRDAWAVKVINMSLGVSCGQPLNNSDGKDAMCQLVNLAESMGIVVVTAAGNDTHVGIPTPAASSRAITVAAAQTQNTVTRADDTVACFSNRGPRADDGNSDPLDEQKPDVAAPGTHAATCLGDCLPLASATGIFAARFNTTSGGIAFSGTSMASPAVAGLAALIMQAKPGINAASVKQLIIDTATSAAGAPQAWQPDNGFGYVNGFAAINTAVRTDMSYPSYPPPTSWLSPDISVSSPLKVGVLNTATVQIQNRGPQSANNVKVIFGVYVFSAPTPAFQSIGTVNVPFIASGATLPVSTTWTPANASHQCMMVEIAYGPDTDFSNNKAQRNLNVQASPLQFQVQNTLTEGPTTINLIPTLGAGISNWSFELEPRQITMSAIDCPVTATAQLFPGANVPPGEQATLNVAAVANTVFGPVLLGGVTVVGKQPKQETNSMPTLRLVKFGATPDQAQAAARAFGLTSNDVTLVNGEVSFLDPSNYLAAPTVPVTNPDIIRMLTEQSENPFPNIPLGFEAPNFLAFSNTTVVGANAAVEATAKAFAGANLVPPLGMPIPGNTMLTTVYSNDNNVVLSNNVPLDTVVNYRFATATGIPIVGPGAQVQVAFMPTGGVSRWHYAAPILEEGREVPILPPATVIARARRFMDPQGFLKPVLIPRLVYFVPHWPWPPCLSCPPPNIKNTVLPWYEVIGTATVVDPNTGAQSTVELMPMMLPATDDPEFTPAVTLTADAQGPQVFATARVTGGMPPYTYEWAGSSPTISSNTGSEITYTMELRLDTPTLTITRLSEKTAMICWPDPSTGFELFATPSLMPTNWQLVTGQTVVSNGLKCMTVDLTGAERLFRLQHSGDPITTSETVVVTVTDANGVQVQEMQTVQVTVTPKLASGKLDLFPKVGGITDWGTENSLSPGICAGDGVGWQTGMHQPGGGVERYRWNGALAWKKDFIEAPVGFNNLWVDNADITLYCGHGAPTVITFVGGPGPDPLNLWHNQAPRAWGNVDDEWLCFLSCSVLPLNDAAGNAWQRWGGNFDGLHILTGFRNTAWAGTGFPKLYADNLLGIGKPAMRVRQAWFSAAAAKENRADGTGRAAAMGPIGPGGVWNYNDYYWGKGPVTPDIRWWQFHGWWWLGQP
jgi:subtilisin family serine protease